MKKVRESAWLMAILFIAAAHAEKAQPQQGGQMSAAPYLLRNAPTFDMTIAQFRAGYNAKNREFPLYEYRAIQNHNGKNHLTRAVSKINEHLYTSTALEPGTGKIKTLQITWLPGSGADEQASKEKAIAYMAALLRFFEPVLSAEESQRHINELLNKGKGFPFYTQTEGALRFVIADHGENGLTFAVEPIRLALVKP